MLNESNYFAPGNRIAYMGYSQFKAFSACPAAALAKIRGEWSEESTTALLVGSYVDAHFSGTLDTFRGQHPEIFVRSGDLKAEYRHANTIINRIERDPLMMEYLSGIPQVIMSGIIEGVPVKIKIDSYHPGKRIVDQKIMKDFAPVWVDGEGRKPFVEAWGYDIQAAIYQEIESQNSGDRLPFVIAGATKEKEPDLGLFEIPQDRIDYVMEEVRAMIGHYAEIKAGRIDPERCENCDYCKATKVLRRVIDYREVG